MSLEGLVQHAPTQTAAIDRLIDLGYFSPGPISLVWTAFKESVWGKPLGSFQAEKLVERDSRDHVEDRYTTPDSVPEKTWVTVIPDTVPISCGPSNQVTDFGAVRVR